MQYHVLSGQASNDYVRIGDNLGRLRQVVCYERFAPSLTPRNQCNMDGRPLGCACTPRAATNDIRDLGGFYPLLARPFRECSGAFICTYPGIRTRLSPDGSAIKMPVRPRDAGPERQARRRRLGAVQ